MVAVLFVVAAIRIIFFPLPDRKSPLEVIIRFLWVWGTVYWLRACVVGLTRFPRLYPTEPAPNNGLWQGIWDFVTGVQPSEADFMFSGHTATMTLLGLFVSYYTFRRFMSQVFWILVLFGYFVVISARIHYTADVAVAIALSYLVFSLFHAWFDPEWLYGYRSSLTVDMDPGTTLALPVTIMDANGNRWATNFSSSLGSPNMIITVGPYTNPSRRRMYEWFSELLVGTPVK